MTKKVYAYKNNKNELMKSSSGGAFIALCKAFELKFGQSNVAFCGAAFDENLEVTHQCVFSTHQCGIFQGSKYVRSNCNYIFPYLKDIINDGKYLLFSGTPCQVYAFNKYLEKENIEKNKVITIDIICHGTPKKEIWEDYKIWIESKAKSKLDDYSFRYKPEGWKAYPAYAHFENGKKMINTSQTSVYSKLHLSGYSINKGCFSCLFSKEERVGDITLGDYWGVEKTFPDIDKKNGVSLILVNSAIGLKLIGCIAEGEGVLRECKDKIYLKYQHNLNRPTVQPDDYQKFWDDYQKFDFETMLKKYIGYGIKYKLVYKIKKLVRKTPIIEWYRSKK